MANTTKYKIEVESKTDKIKQTEKAVDDLRDSVEKTGDAAKDTGDALSQWAQTSMALNALSDLCGKVNSQLQAAASSFDDFDKSMRAANTMMGLSEDQFQSMKDSISELSKDVPKTRAELAEGLYQVISNGVSDPVEALKLLETSARSSVGGIADLSQVIGVTATIWKNYGLDASAAADIQDKIQLTAKNGVTSFEQLAAALPAVSGNAATLGVSIDELLASFATLTGVSGNTAAVSTQLGAIFTAMVKPSSEAAKMAEDMGIKFDAATIQAAGGFQNFLAQLKTAVSEYAAASGTLEQEVYGRLFGSAEAMKALIPLQGELADKYIENVNNMVNSSGTMDDAFEQMSSTGEAASIMMQNAVAAATDWATSFASSTAPVLNYVAAIGDFGVALGGIGGAMKTAITALSKMEIGTKLASVAQGIYNAVMSANPIALVVLALAALGAAFAAAYSYCEPFANFVDNIWQTIKKYLTPVFETLGKVVSKVFSYFAKLFGLDGEKQTKKETKAVNDEAKAYEKLAGAMSTAGSIKVGSMGGKKGDKKAAPKGSIKEIENNISTLEEKISLEVDPQSRQNLYNELEKLKAQKIKIEADLEFNKDSTAAVSKMLSDLDEMELDNSIKALDDEEKAMRREIRAVGDSVKENEKFMEANRQVGSTADNILTTASAFDSLGSAIGGAAGDMVSWAAQNVAALTQVIAQIVTMITAKEAESIAGATASGSSLPFPANIAAIAAGIATVIASFAKMPKFANGGIISGPTVGLMGEYSGASNNPEVVAPLNRLKSLIGDTGFSGKVEFRQRGRDLRGVLVREQSIRSRQ